MQSMSPRARRAGWIVAAGATIALCWNLCGSVRPAVRKRRPNPPVSRVIAPSAPPPAERTSRAGMRAAAPDEDGGGWTPADDIEPPRPRPSDPHWLVKFFAPHPGESLLDYRDRVLPVVQAAAAPQRARVARNLESFAQTARLTAEQRRALDSAVGEAAGAIQDRVFQAVMSGEILPPRLKPSSGVALARDVLDSMDRANQRFVESLDSGQREQLAASRFDVIDYLVFSTRWEDMLGVTE